MSRVERRVKTLNQARSLPESIVAEDCWKHVNEPGFIAQIICGISQLYRWVEGSIACLDVYGFQKNYRRYASVGYRKHSEATKTPIQEIATLLEIHQRLAMTHRGLLVKALHRCRKMADACSEQWYYGKCGVMAAKCVRRRS